MTTIPRTLYHVTSRENAFLIWTSGAIDPAFSQSDSHNSFYCRWSKVGLLIAHVMVRHKWIFEEISVLAVKSANQRELFRPLNSVFLCSTKVRPWREYHASVFRRYVDPTIIERVAEYRNSRKHVATKRT